MTVAHRKKRGRDQVLPPQTLAVVAHAACLAAAQGVNLHSVLAWYVREGRPLREAPSFRVCMAEYLQWKRNTNVRACTIHEYSSGLRRLGEYLGDRPLSAVTSRDIVDFLRPWTQPVTRHGWYRRLMTFFGWLVLKKYVPSNPVAELIKPPRHGGSGTCLTLAEAQELLHRARHTDQIGYWALSLFAGMRTTEIKRLEAYSTPWSLVRLEDNMIEVPTGHSKTERRVIPISPVLRAWLLLVRRRGAPFYPNYSSAQQIGVLRRSLIRQYRRISGLKGAFNLGRRSYISYRLALPRASYAETAIAAGNSERMIRQYYRRTVTRADARAYFNLTPACVAKHHG